MFKIININEKFNNGTYIPLLCKDEYVFLEERDKENLIIASFEGEIIEKFTI